MPAFEAWHDYFIAQAGASAALAGLLFVALSINIERILKSPWLPPRAALTMLVLVGSLIEALLALWPHQSMLAIGVEELVPSVVVWIYAIRLAAAGTPPKEYRTGTLLSVVLSQLTTLPAVAAAIALSIGSE